MPSEPIRGQSIEARQKRLDKGQCPIHGRGGGQYSTWRIDKDGRTFAYSRCGRSDCNVRFRIYPREAEEGEFPSYYAELYAKDLHLLKPKKEKSNG